MRYLEVPEAELDNNSIEHALRSVVMGRRNWLHVGQETGGERAANLFSLMGTCRRLGVEPYEYLCDIVPRLGRHLQKCNAPRFSVVTGPVQWRFVSWGLPRGTRGQAARDHGPGDPRSGRWGAGGATSAARRHGGTPPPAPRLRSCRRRARSVGLGDPCKFVALPSPAPGPPAGSIHAIPFTRTGPTNATATASRRNVSRSYVSSVCPVGAPSVFCPMTGSRIAP